MNKFVLALTNQGNRFGNKVMQLHNIVYLCKKYSCKFTTLSDESSTSDKEFTFPFIEFKKLYCYVDNNSLDQQIIKVTSPFNFFYLNTFCDKCNPKHQLNLLSAIILNTHECICNKCSPEFFFQICDAYLKPLLTVKPTIANNRDMHIHIRGEDIFTPLPNGRSVHNKYTQPPLAFYTKLIKDNAHNYDRFIIVTTSDKKNPCIKHLEQFPNVVVQHLSLKEDISSLLGANSIVLSNSTFCIILVVLSSCIKNIFICCSDTSFYFPLKNFNYKKLLVNKYYLKQPYIDVYKWTSSKEQLDLMISYKEEWISKEE